LAHRRKVSAVAVDRPDSFISRWARRKADARSLTHEVDAGPMLPQGPQPPSCDESSAKPVAGGVSGSSPAEPVAGHPGAGAPEPAEDLSPDDVSQFLRQRISDAAHTTALRRLWLTSPAFGASDGLDVYCADYSSHSSFQELAAAAGDAVRVVAAQDERSDGCSSAASSCDESDLPQSPEHPSRD
jgi:hypothetical protein